MDRRGFLRGLGLLAGYAAIPKSILPVTDFIESKSAPSIKQGKFINHMIIQRRSVRITGSVASQVLWFNYDDDKANRLVGEKIIDERINWFSLNNKTI